MPIFMPISKEVWNLKYRFNNESEDEFYERIAKTLFSDDEEKKNKFLKYFKEHKICMGGRVLYALGTERKNQTLSNCYVIPLTDDSMKGIMQHATEIALTMKSGGGVGMSYSILRPKSEVIRTTNSKSSGPVSFMEIANSICETIAAGGNRRGAMLASLGIWHPDIEEFIFAKREKDKLKNMNISIEMDDEFMEAVEKDEDWKLIFPDINHPAYEKEWDGNIRKWKEKGYPVKVYKTVKARELYQKIMESNYNYAEPGILFIDRMNKYDPVASFVPIQTTNPCGEQPLPFVIDKENPKNNMYFSCNLSMVNLANFVKNPFKDDVYFDLDEFIDALMILTEATDRIIDLNYYPLPEMYKGAKHFRIIGIGFTGLGDMLAMLKIPYASEESFEIVEEIMKTFAITCYYKSALLANEKGEAPIFHDASKRKKYLKCKYIQFILSKAKEGIKKHDKIKFDKNISLEEMAKTVQETIEKKGLRNSRLFTVAPTGTTSLFMNNVSSGIEPIFSLEYYRKVRDLDGNEKEELIEDYAWNIYKSLGKPDGEKPDYFVTALELSPYQHIDMQALVQKYIDGSISKTINIPEDYSYEDFVKVYEYAWKKGLKGCTTYRPNPYRGYVLKTKEEEEKKKEDINEMILKMMKNGIRPLIKKGLLPDEDAKRYIVYWKGIKVYLNVVHDEEGYPLEVTFTLPPEAGMGKDGIWYEDLFLERMSYWTAVCRLVSTMLRYGIPLEEVIEQLEKSTFNIAHLPGLVARVLKKYPLEELNGDDDEEEERGHEVMGRKCPSCGENKLIRYQGCDKCLNCGYSKCD